MPLRLLNHVACDADFARFSGPLFITLYVGLNDGYSRFKGFQIYYLQPNHWSCILRDHSCETDSRQQENKEDYFLRSELLAIFSILFRQMNELVWVPNRNQHSVKLKYKEGSLTVCEYSTVP